MIVNIEQKKGSLIISYINKEGEVAYMKLNIPMNQQYQYLESHYQNSSTPNIKSWDNKMVRKAPTDFLNKHRIQEFFMDAGEEITAPLFEHNMPNLYSCDIEVDVTDDGFPEAKHANNRINTIAWSRFPDVTVFGLKELSGHEIEEIQENLDKHLKPIGKKYNFLYKVYANEADMLYDFLYNYARHAPLITGWNFWGYDWQYICNRCNKINMDISWMSPTKQWYKHRITERGKKLEIMLPQHKLIVDYLTIYKKWDRSIDIKENDSLDFVSGAALGISKVKYPGGFQELYAKDFDQYVFYNAIDTILVEEIHNKIKTMDTFLGLGNITQVEAMKAFSPINMLEATLDRYAYQRKQVFPKINSRNHREDYEGAFVFEPISNLYEWVVSFDFASLYPSIMRQFNISVENFLLKDKNHNIKPNEIKCSNGSVFDSNNNPLLPEILTNFYNQRREEKKVMILADQESDALSTVLKRRKLAANTQIL
jgi:DNA polymerase elongation subunit (family B)